MANTDTKATKKVVLHHKEFLGYEFGPDRDSAIIFGPRSGNLPGYTVVDENNPLLDELLRDPNIEVVDDQLGGAKVYVSPIEPGREFKSEQALQSHVRAAAKKGDELAKSWLARFNGEAEPVDDGGTRTSHDGVVSSDPVKPTFGAP